VDEVSPFELVEPTPDSMWFERPERVGEALLRDRTGSADRLGEALTGQAHLFAFEVRWGEEHGRVLASTRRTQLPVVSFAVVSFVVTVVALVKIEPEMFVAAKRHESLSSGPP
jgi:hypothetical protein